MECYFRNKVCSASVYIQVQLREVCRVNPGSLAWQRCACSPRNLDNRSGSRGKFGEWKRWR